MNAAAAAIGLLLVAWNGAAPAAQDTRPSFAEWLQAVRDEAVERGIRPATVDEALGEIEEPLPIVLERDRTQAEVVLSLDTYIARSLTARRIRAGRQMAAQHKGLLDQVSERYGVPARVLVAIWGIESEYGRFSGVRPTITALATLAWDPRRATLFRSELFDALQILDRGDITLAQMKGSWAGAMGQVQFMPSSYVKYAEDFDGDGRRDIWSTTGDVFASIANYLKGHGWTDGASWGREVSLAPAVARQIRRDIEHRESSCRAVRDLTVPLPMQQWRKLGVRLPGSRNLPATQQPASLVMGDRRNFVVYANYDALLEYNCSNAYALTVALLSDAIGSSSPLPKSRPVRKPAKRRRKA